MSLDDLKLEDLKLSDDELRECRSCSKQLKERITRLLKARANTTDRLECVVEKLKDVEIVSNMITIAGTIITLHGIHQSDTTAKDIGGIVSHAAKLINVVNSKTEITKAMADIDADFCDQQLSGVTDSEIFETVNDKIVQAIKERRGQVEIQKTWFKEGVLFMWSLFNILNDCAKLMKGTSLIESFGMTGEAAKHIDQIIEGVHKVQAPYELMKSIGDLYKGSEPEGIKKVKVVIKALRKQQQLWQEVFQL